MKEEVPLHSQSNICNLQWKDSYFYYVSLKITLLNLKLKMFHYRGGRNLFVSLYIPKITEFFIEIAYFCSRLKSVIAGM